MTELNKIGLHKTAPHLARKLPIRRRVMQKFGAFISDQDGSMTILTLFMFVLFLLMGGIGLDVMNHEMKRAKLTSTLDAAVLAAAGAPQGSSAADIKAIVEDYFLKAGLAEFLNEIDIDGEGTDDITTSLNATKVTASASMTIDTYLLQLAGIETMNTDAIASAEVRTPKLEVSLVLDVSGSMNGSKLSNLKTAAKEFVSTILSSGDPGEISISLIPFSFGVTPSLGINNALTVNETHDYSTCLVFNQAQFGETAIDPAVPYPQQIFTSVYGSFDNLNDSWRSCYTDDYFSILPYSMSVTDLHAKIDSLEADGNTSGQLGIKWGAALLDPAFQSVATSLKAAGEMDALLDNVPSSWGEAETLKVIVMMGDGKNTTSYYFDDPNGLLDTSTAASHTQNDYRGPNSDLYRVEFQEMVFKYAFHIKKKKKKYDESKCSNPAKWKCEYEPNGVVYSGYYLRNPSDNNYYDIENGDWLNQNEFDDLADVVETPEFVGREQLSWEEAWGLMSPNYYWSITGRTGPWNDYVGSGKITGTTKNTRMSSACTAIKNRSVVVYTIGFEVSVGGTAETAFKNCASSPAHYFPVQGTSINNAFSSIASNVQNLRLTQ